MTTSTTRAPIFGHHIGAAMPSADKIPILQNHFHRFLIQAIGAPGNGEHLLRVLRILPNKCRHDYSKAKG